MATTEEHRHAGDEQLAKSAGSQDEATAARMTGLATAHALLAIAGELSGIRRELAKRKR